MFRKRVSESRTELPEGAGGLTLDISNAASHRLCGFFDAEILPVSQDHYRSAAWPELTERVEEQCTEDGVVILGCGKVEPCGRLAMVMFFAQA